MALRPEECYTARRMNERQAKLLMTIIDQFVQTALPVGSKRLLETSDFAVSSATIRAEMAMLEDEGFLVQPHISAGRVPTAKGYRMFVQKFMDPTDQEQTVRTQFSRFRDEYFKHKDQERVYDAVAMMARMVPNISFATIPHREQVYYMGLSNVLKQPEFQENPKMAASVVEVLEGNLTNALSHLSVDDEIRYYIGEENILPQMQSCSLIVRSYEFRGAHGTIGILGPLRMDYAYNTVALDIVTDLLQTY